MNANSKIQKIVPPAVLAVVAVVAVTGCGGGGVPSNAVASVDGNAITKSQYEKVAKIFASQGLKKGEKPVVPDPPAYTNCIAAKKQKNPKSSDSVLKSQCKAEFENAKQTIMQSLIQNEWYKLEAEDRDIKVTDEQVRQRFVPLKKQTFPKEADYKKFLADTGQTEEDILGLIRVQIYQEKIREKTQATPEVSDKEVEAMYNKDKERFSQPASRDLRVVFNSSKAKANAAKAALDGGKDWAAVVKEYSKDEVSKANGGKYPKVTKGQFEPSLDKAVFSAKIGDVIGPIKTQFGYYVFTVDKSYKAKQQTLKEARGLIKQTIQAEKQQKSYDTFQKEFEKKWKEKTECDPLYTMDFCKNAPKKSATGATGSAPQGGGE